MQAWPKAEHPSYRHIADAVRGWLPSQLLDANIEQSQEQHGWWCKVTPYRDGACPFTFGISDQGEYDLLLGKQFSQEQWPWPDGVDPVDLCEAIVQGKVTETSWRTKWFDLPVKCVTTVELAAAPKWWTDVWGILFFVPLALCRKREYRYRPYRDAPPAPEQSG